jgi:hypothetical protein
VYSHAGVTVNDVIPTVAGHRECGLCRQRQHRSCPVGCAGRHPCQQHGSCRGFRCWRCVDLTSRHSVCCRSACCCSWIGRARTISRYGPAGRHLGWCWRPLRLVTACHASSSGRGQVRVKVACIPSMPTMSGSRHAHDVREQTWLPDLGRKEAQATPYKTAHRQAARPCWQAPHQSGC